MCLPGFIDAHNHPTAGGLTKPSVLEGLVTPDPAWQPYLTCSVEYNRITVSREDGWSVTGLWEHSRVGSTCLSTYSTITKDPSGEGIPLGLSTPLTAHNSFAGPAPVCQVANWRHHTDYRIRSGDHGRYVWASVRQLRLTIESGHAPPTNIFDLPPATSRPNGLAQLSRSGSDLTWLPPVRPLANTFRHLAEEHGA
uniref:Uncharacterized protein n=1 Tax=Mycobacterium riyadhense TaxID=486698 RepID=A0A653F1H2_9MYCO|nr:hypothetical protein BIN_B_05051 [Mycobacterium riyadhense]